MSICLYMGVEGIRRGIPRLWAYFALSQILPISFAQNLFYIALLKAPSFRGRNAVRLPLSLTAGVVLSYGGCLLLAIFPVAWRVLDRAPFIGAEPAEKATYSSLAAEGEESKYLIPTILVARLLLVLPFFLPKLGHSKLPLYKVQLLVCSCAILMTAGVVWLLCDLDLASLKYLGVSHDLLPALWSHPAVTSLGFDFLVSAMSAIVWMLSGIESDDALSDQEAAAKAR